MQIISGMGLGSYWISNMIADMIKLYIPIFVILIISVIFDSNYPGVWVLMLLLPPALVPFTYNTSFLFKTDSQAQIITLILNYFILDVRPAVYSIDIRIGRLLEVGFVHQPELLCDQWYSLVVHQVCNHGHQSTLP
jgi:hypothetical protein